MFALLRELYVLLQRRAARQFVRFAAVGATNTVLDFGVYLGLTRGFEWWGSRHVLAATASFCVAVTSSFILNTFWTFGADGPGWEKRLPKFVTVATGGLALNALLLHLLITAGHHDVLGKLLATGAVMIWNFSLQKGWTFRAVP